MRKQYLIVLALIAVAAVLVFLFRTKSPAEPAPKVEIIKADDGLARLEIPESALADGTNLGDIRIRRLSNDALPFVVSEGGPVVAYALEPDGLSFPKSILLTMTLPAGNAFSLPTLVTA